MAIAQTATGTQGYSNANPVTMAFDCSGGDLLVLGLCIYTDVRAGGAPTYNGVAMTASPEGAVDSGSIPIVEMWYLVSPASGSNTISIPNTGTEYIVPIASAWSGVDTADPLDTSNSASANTSTNPNCQVTTAAANELVIDVMYSNLSSVPTANSHTLIFSTDEGSQTSNAQYTTSQSPAGNITLSWTIANDRAWAMIVCAFNVAGGGTKYEHAVDVTVTGTVSESKVVKPYVSIAVTATPAIANVIYFYTSLTVTATPTIFAKIKQLTEVIVTATTAVAAMVKKNVSITVTVIVSSFAKVKHLVEVIVTGSASSFVKVKKNVSVVVTASPTAFTKIKYLVEAAVTATVSSFVKVKYFSKVTATATPSIATRKIIHHVVNATVTATVASYVKVKKNVSVIVTGSVSIFRKIKKYASVSVAGIVTVIEEKHAVIHKYYETVNVTVTATVSIIGHTAMLVGIKQIATAIRSKTVSTYIRVKEIAKSIRNKEIASRL